MGFGSGIRKIPIQDPGSRIQGSKRQMRIHNAAFLFFFLLNFYAFLSNLFFLLVIKKELVETFDIKPVPRRLYFPALQ
jgi:hypothetical protein